MTPWHIVDLHIYSNLAYKGHQGPRTMKTYQRTKKQQLVNQPCAPMRFSRWIRFDLLPMNSLLPGASLPVSSFSTILLHARDAYRSWSTDFHFIGPTNWIVHSCSCKFQQHYDHNMYKMCTCLEQLAWMFFLHLIYLFKTTLSHMRLWVVCNKMAWREILFPCASCFYCRMDDSCFDPELGAMTNQQ